MAIKMSVSIPKANAGVTDCAMSQGKFGDCKCEGISTNIYQGMLTCDKNGTRGCVVTLRIVYRYYRRT